MLSGKATEGVGEWGRRGAGPEEGNGEWNRFVDRGFVWKVDLKGIEVGGITGVRKGRGY